MSVIEPIWVRVYKLTLIDDSSYASYEREIYIPNNKNLK